MSEPAPFITLENVAKTYGHGPDAVLAVSDVSFEIREGELLSLVGPSGCGKSTLLKILAELHDYDSGTVRIGNAASPFEPGRDVGMVFQQALLLKWRTITENVLLPAEILGLPSPPAASARAISWRWSGWPRSGIAIPMSCPAACSSAPPSPAPWSITPSLS
jgi:NitT/TauT family transport system ATP-binding protein